MALVIRRQMADLQCIGVVLSTRLTGGPKTTRSTFVRILNVSSAYGRGDIFARVAFCGETD